MRDATHSEQIERWAQFCKKNMKKAQQVLTPFINSQIEIANAFYKRLSKLPNGKEKIRKIKRLA